MSKKPTFMPRYPPEYNVPTSSVSAILGKALTGEANELMRAIIDNKASLNMSNEFGKTVLHLFIDNDKLRPNELLNLVKQAVNMGAPIDLADAAGVRPLHLAAQKQNRKLVEYLIKKGAEPNATTHTKLTAMHYAIIPKTVNCKPRSFS